MFNTDSLEGLEAVFGRVFKVIYDIFVVRITVFIMLSLCNKSMQMTDFISTVLDRLAYCFQYAIYKTSNSDVKIIT